jgi:hypothetical protein
MNRRSPPSNLRQGVPLGRKGMKTARAGHTFPAPLFGRSSRYARTP